MCLHCKLQLEMDFLNRSLHLLFQLYFMKSRLLLSVLLQPSSQFLVALWRSAVVTSAPQKRKKQPPLLLMKTRRSTTNCLCFTMRWTGFKLKQFTEELKPAVNICLTQTAGSPRAYWTRDWNKPWALWDALPCCVFRPTGECLTEDKDTLKSVCIYSTDVCWIHLLTLRYDLLLLSDIDFLVWYLMPCDVMSNDETLV